jgi:hypothetical protein
MKQKLPTLAGVILASCLLVGCSISKADREMSCKVECSLCTDLKFTCDRSSRSDSAEALPTPDIILKN